jgi:hypothetical protein
MQNNFSTAVVYNGENIWVKPLCDFFEINVQNQYRKIKKDKILSKLRIKMSEDFGEIDKNGRILLNKKGFLRWVQIINPNTVKPEAREQFILFQELVFDYLYGNANAEAQAKIDYERIKRYRKLYGKIGRELQRLERSFGNYIEGKFNQLSINFDNDKEVQS